MGRLPDEKVEPKREPAPILELLAGLAAVWDAAIVADFSAAAAPPQPRAIDSAAEARAARVVVSLVGAR